MTDTALQHPSRVEIIRVIARAQLVRVGQTERNEYWLFSFTLQSAVYGKNGNL